ncbi:hypothetical protein SODALDRAFT_356211 [Sodiomyces alkalinus F11]|uniref:Uncharacterized protein n=1 Tax=Sodiomyces alkalinus (strain CBS 110278 / VKM F-3762 / F11) TaxID=1314773 RepID=A0A3N2Q0G5_SODAK|nr:hypothetical protein SODALDRAFT_356211 [Sodiomyces alkalinus F11]ROT40253.1 hypothetical protein SODALDRAFT_356211 [Sodiomyces alkalinus F11]
MTSDEIKIDNVGTTQPDASGDGSIQAAVPCLPFLRGDYLGDRELNPQELFWRLPLTIQRRLEKWRGRGRGAKVEERLRGQDSRETIANDVTKQRRGKLRIHIALSGRQDAKVPEVLILGYLTVCMQANDLIITCSVLGNPSRYIQLPRFYDVIAWNRLEASDFGRLVRRVPTSIQPTLENVTSPRNLLLIRSARYGKGTPLIDRNDEPSWRSIQSPSAESNGLHLVLCGVGFCGNGTE